jgi:hypothetical protein
MGCLMWLANSTRLDVCFATRYLAQFNQSPNDAHWLLARRTLAYLLHTMDYGLVLGGAPGPLEGWVDADFAGCKVTRKSTTGYVFKFCGGTIDWQSKRQSTVVQSTLEAEYIAASEAAREATWLRSLLKELGFKQDTTRLNCDNQGAISLANNPGMHARSKHIEVRHHYIQEKVDAGELDIFYVRSEDQQADILTKPLPRNTHADLCTRLQLGASETYQVSSATSSEPPSWSTCDCDSICLCPEDLQFYSTTIRIIHYDLFRLVRSRKTFQICLLNYSFITNTTIRS